NLLMILVTDENDGLVFAGKLECFKMDFRHERASGINDFKIARLGFVANRRWNAVSAKNEDRTVRNFFDGLDKNRATAAELLHNIRVMNNFVMYVDRGTIGFERQLDNVYGSNHARAKSARAHTQKYFPVGSSRHLLPNLGDYQNSIIP